MTNREKFKELILDIVCNGDSVAVDLEEQKPVNCTEIRCIECKFDMDGISCGSLRKQWCNEEYTEPPVDWSKVPVDTPILVRDHENEPWKHRYFARYENGWVYAWGGGTTSWSAENDYANKTDWRHAKLAEDGE